MLCGVLFCAKRTKMRPEFFSRNQQKTLRGKGKIWYDKTGECVSLSLHRKGRVPVKKLVRLTALLLAGALLLLMTACGAPAPLSEAEAKQALLDEINAVRASRGWKPLDEVDSLSRHENQWMAAFRLKEKTVVTSQEAPGAYDTWFYNTQHESEYIANKETGHVADREKGEFSLVAALEVQNGKVKLPQEIAQKADAFGEERDVAIGLVVAQIGGKMYFSYTTYRGR